MFDNDRSKVIKAVKHLHGNAKTQWDTHIEFHPEDEYNWVKFFNWLGKTIRGHGNFELSTHQEFTDARQTPNQDVWAFDAYLTSLEVELDPVTEKTRARNFLSRLLPELRRAIERSGSQVPETRMDMVHLADRMWRSFQEEARAKRKEANTPSGEKPIPHNNASRSSWHSGSKEHTTEQKEEDKASNKSRGTNGKFIPTKFPSGLNDKGYRICYKCGSTEHLANYHFQEQKQDDKPDEKTTEPNKESKEKTPTVKTITTNGSKREHDRMSQRAWEMTDSEDDSEN
jgi:hypothetical protein